VNLDVTGGGARLTWAGTSIGAAALVAAAVLLYVVDPQAVDWLPKCPFHQLTGWHCPGCGGTRAAHAMLHGDFAQALAFNPLLIVGGPVLIAICVWRRMRDGAGWSLAIRPAWIWGLFALLVLFTLLRNLPVYPLYLLAPH
jgi:hypothetical protein